MSEIPPLKRCFVISPIGEDGSDARKRSDLVLKYVIQPAATACGYDPIRADQIAEPGIITSQVIQHIIDDPLVIADLTDRNPNVFYELALRHAIRKPLVQLIRKGDLIPFDVSGMRTISVDHHDLESVDQAKDAIISQIRAVEANPSNLETPISVALQLQLLGQSENPEERSLGEILAAVSDLRSDVSKVRNSLERLESGLGAGSLRRGLGMARGLRAIDLKDDIDIPTFLRPTTPKQGSEDKAPDT